MQQAIDKGSFGTVYKAVNKGALSGVLCSCHSCALELAVDTPAAEDGRLYAMKQVSLKGLNRADRQEAIDEVIPLSGDASTARVFRAAPLGPLFLPPSHQARILASVDFPYITEHYDSFIGAPLPLSVPPLKLYAHCGTEPIKRMFSSQCRHLHRRSSGNLSAPNFLEGTICRSIDPT